jgi:ArsR family transcriptional regulator
MRRLKRKLAARIQLSAMPSAAKSEKLSETQMQRIARALADPRRYEILKMLSSKASATPCCQMVERFDISPATLSHHMKELETAGLVRSEKNGKFVNYFPQSRVLRAYLNRLKSELS